jgi:dTDP-4-amino-4,6-dideoxygalactose transaminase
LADILLGQLKEADAQNEHRKKIAALYDAGISKKIEKPLTRQAHSSECLYLRYPILTDNQQGLMKRAKKHKIILGDWYNAVIAPRDSETDKAGYQPGSCPKAEELSGRVVNLPTGRSIDEKKAKLVIKAVNGWKQ